MQPRLGLILLFEGDHRKVNAPIKNVTTFTAVTAVLKNGDVDVTGTYINASPGPTSAGNLLISDDIGAKASMPQGNYRYYITGTYGNTKKTWYWDVMVLPKNLELIAGVELQDGGAVAVEDYCPFAGEITCYEGDNFVEVLTIPDVEFAASPVPAGVLNLGSDDKTVDYCNGVVAASGQSLTTHNIGGAAAILAGDYGYFISASMDNGEKRATWFYKIRVMPKQSII